MAKSEEKIINNQNNTIVDTYQDANGNVQNINNNSAETSTQNISETSGDVQNADATISETSTPDTNAVDPVQNIEPQKNSFDFMMRNFKRESSGKVAEVRKREAYVPPSLKRKEKSENARRRKRRSY